MNELTPILDVGSLVRTNSGTKHHGALGLVVRVRPRWHIDPQEDELLVTVLYSNGKEIDWCEYQLEVLA